MNSLATDEQLIDIVQAFESTFIRSLPVTLICSDRHSHGPCMHIVSNCAYCMLHGNVFVHTTYDKETIVNTHLLQDN